MEIKSKNSLIIACVYTLLSMGYSCGERIDHDTPQNFVGFLKTIDSSVQDIFVQDKQIHVRILLDSSDVGCDEQWNFKNMGLALAIASNDKWRNYIDSNDYTLFLHRALDYQHGDFDYLSVYSSTDIVKMSTRFPDAQLVSREINYVTENYSCLEYREIYLVLKTYKDDTIFVSGDTCFSQLFSNCRANKNSGSCKDIEKLRSMCDEVLQDTTYPVCDSLTRHFLELDRISSTK